MTDTNHEDIAKRVLFLALKKIAPTLAPQDIQLTPKQGTPEEDELDKVKRQFLRAAVGPVELNNTAGVSIDFSDKPLSYEQIRAMAKALFQASRIWVSNDDKGLHFHGSLEQLANVKPMDLELAAAQQAGSLKASR